MNKTIKSIIKIAATAAVVGSVLAGCSLFDCGRKDCCCGKPSCECRCTTKCCEKKTSGMNASVTLGAGTDGVTVGTAANAGSHGTSAGVSADAGRSGVGGAATGSMH